MRKNVSEIRKINTVRLHDVTVPYRNWNLTYENRLQDLNLK